MCSCEWHFIPASSHTPAVQTTVNNSTLVFSPLLPHPISPGSPQIFMACERWEIPVRTKGNSFTCTPSPKRMLGPTWADTVGGHSSVQIGDRLQFISAVIIASRDLYPKMWKIMSLGPVECFMQGREMASLGFLLKIQGKGFWVIHFLLQKRHEPTQLVPTNRTH